MVAEMHKYQWDEENRTITTVDEATREKEVKAFESASWFKDEFGLLAKAAGKEKNYAAPEALYDLAGAGSVKTIHDRHEKSKGVKEKEKETKENQEDNEKEKENNKKKKKEVIKLTSGESSGESSSSESSSSSTSRDSASQSSSDSEESSLSNKRSRSKGRRGEKSDTGAARGG
jgi:hypothetical protein